MPSQIEVTRRKLTTFSALGLLSLGAGCDLYSTTHKWSTDLQSPPADYPLSIADGIVTTLRSGDVLLIDDTGDITPLVTLPVRRLTTQPIETGDHLYVVGAESIYTISIQKRRIIGVSEHPSSSVSPYPPAYVTRNFYFNTPSGVLELGTDGTVSRYLETESAGTTITASGNRLYRGTDSLSVTAHSADDLTEEWRLSLDTGGGGSKNTYVCSDQDTVFVTSTAGLKAIDGTTGDELWGTDRRYTSNVAPDVASSTVFSILSADGEWTLFAHEPNSGEEIWRETLPAGSVVPPTATSEGVAVGAWDGTVLLFGLDGRKKITYQHDSSVTTRPVIRDGQVITASSHGEVSCYEFS